MRAAPETRRLLAGGSHRSQDYRNGPRFFPIRLSPINVANVANYPCKPLILLYGGPGKLKTSGGRASATQAVAQRAEPAHFEPVHIAPFDPAVL